MEIYTVVENGDAYPLAYSTYKQAVNEVKRKHKEQLDEDEKSLKLPENQGLQSCNEIDVPESKERITRLYIEKGIHIEIHRLPVITNNTYTLEDLFTLVARNSFHVTDKQRNQLFQQICTELDERYSVERPALREMMNIPELTLEEHCKECNTPVTDYGPEDEVEDPVLCFKCMHSQKK
jgi:hypothetical protein